MLKICLFKKMRHSRNFQQMQLGKEPLERDKCIFHPSADIGPRVPGSRSVPAVAVLDGSTQHQFGFCLSRDIKMFLKISSFVTNGVRRPLPFFFY